MVWKPPYVTPEPGGAPSPASAPADTLAPATTGSGWKPPYVSPELSQQSAPPPSPPPDPNAYKPPDWLPGAGWAHKIGQVFDDAFTLGGADVATAKAGEFARAHGVSNTTPDLPRLRAETEQARTDVGPAASTAADIAGYTMGPGKILGGVGGRLAPTIGRYGAAAFEGGSQGALSNVGHTIGSDDFNPLDVAIHGVTGAGIGTGSQALADAAMPAVRRVTDYVTGKVGRAGENWGTNAPLRSDYQAGQNITPDLDTMIGVNRNRLPSDAPAMVALRNARDASNQSIEPGMASRMVIYPTLGYAGALAGQQLPGLNEAVGGVTGFGFGELAAKGIGEPIAKGVNQIDKNIAVNEALDRLYPYATGQPRSTVNLAPFTQAVRQSAIATQRGPSDALNRYIITGHW